MDKINYRQLSLTQLVRLLLRAERLIALIESGVQILESIEPENQEYMLKAAYAKKTDIEKELTTRKLPNRELFLPPGERLTMYAGSIEELRQKGMQAPISHEPNQAAV